MAAMRNESTAPGMANGAQIPLNDFNLPQLPTEAGGLIALTLTSVISVEQYGNVLQQPWKVTHLPPSIQSLTLESFTRGYPTGFLRALIAELPELRSLIVYGQSFTGASEETEEDAVTFIKGARKLRALHLLDTFITASFVKTIAPVVKSLEKPLMFLEINYTYGRGNNKLTESVPAGELSSLIHHGLISCTFNIAPPENANNGVDIEPLDDGVQTIDSSFSEFLITSLVGEDSAPRFLKNLNITLYTICIEQFRSLIVKHEGLMALSASISVSNVGTWKGKVFDAIAEGRNLEQVEIVLCPTHQVGELDVSLDEQRLAELSKACKKLKTFKINQRRCIKTKSSLECSVIAGSWKIDLKLPEVRSEAARTKKLTKEIWSPWT
ncbi:uncharacterized protein PV09_05533 [Verruconis gallopava]|uniref:FBD domain-containing protein n=1 Tax=Verruconis gallopava TaxID=253628 RepID=A0A0D1YRS2_9PEZI|nr:uncharacterized protein PV09_05533 [Verruconis gallopava]KIW03322.1 hypothetical protein PV09_05533 [Verruconis gallopava]